MNKGEIRGLRKKIELRESKGLESPKMQQRLQELQAGRTGAVAPPTNQAVNPVNTATSGFDNTNSFANNYMGDVFGQLQGQGQFNPQGLPKLDGDYGQMRREASDSVMNEFNRMNKDRFAYEDENFEQQMAEQGVDPASEKYQYLKKQNDLSRGSQIQGAQNNAFQMGQSEQAQGFGQALSANNQMYGQQFNNYQIPMQQLNSMTPFYQGQAAAWQNQQNMNFQGNQAELGRQHDMTMGRQQHRWNMQLQASAPQGGGGGGGGQPPIWAQYGFSGPMEYDQYKFNQQLLLQTGGLQPGQRGPNAGDAAINGFAQGAGAAIGSTLVR
jgi:hypothetical protein